ncbi:MAG: phosphoenolpyruvate--protein phosphotransferase, partial [Treponema sp.]|nr:phosphoenolpyruvate--protein phosphotransferase [Treponema sp.]
LDTALALLEEAKSECTKKGQGFSDSLETGTMIEIPAAAMIAEALAERSDFFSIGTNDLVQYALAADRGNARVSYLAQPFHPAVLRLIRQTIDAARKRGIPAAMCGELAGECSATALLLGLGLDEFSMAAASIPGVKHIIRRVNYGACRALAEEALAAPSGAMVREALRRWTGEHLPQELADDL